MKILHLTIKKKWFDMVGNGKPEEYRKVNDYWIGRLFDYHPGKVGGYCFDLHKNGCYLPREFDQVLFANGGHFGNVPKKLFKFDGLEKRTGKKEWGAEDGEEYFVIKLGEKL